MAVKKEIIDSPLKGTLTIKQVASFIVVIGGAAFFLTTIKQTATRSLEQSQENTGILKEILMDKKESERINNIRLTNIELNQREAMIRITNLELEINKK